MGTLNAPFGKYNLDVNLSRDEARKIRTQEHQKVIEMSLTRYNNHH